jgi:hypothetical protein
MNKQRIILLFSLFLIGLFTIFIINTDAANEGCCFINYESLCYEGSSADCTEDQGQFTTGASCASVTDCRIGCCCEALPSNNPYPIRQGTCEDAFGGVFRNLNQNDCTDLCEDTGVPICKASCILNGEDCKGIGIGVNAGNFYCWENNETYGNKNVCDGACPTVGQCISGTEITSDCYCGNNLYSSGYCCWDNTYSSDPLGSDCSVANDCQQHQIGAGSFFDCCDSCLGNLLDPLEHWSNGDYNNGIGDKCLQDTPLCCQECALPLEDCCAYDWECTASGGFVLTSSYSSCPPPDVACNANCIQSICVFNVTISSNPDPKCECAGNYYDTNDITINSNYCCPSGLSPDSCGTDTFDLHGIVYSIDESNKISGANIKIDIDGVLYSKTTDVNGDYNLAGIVLGFNTFDVSIIAEGYYPEIFPLDYPTSGTMNYDFNITPIEGICDELSPPEVVVFNANPVKGRKQVNLTWENPCTIPSKVIGYSIGRDNNPTSGTFYTVDNSFIDDDVEWSDYDNPFTPDVIHTYTYYIQAHYVSGKISPETSTFITMGHRFCEDVFGDEEFCAGNEGYICNDNNDLVIEMQCDATHVCAGPDEDGTTYCRSDAGCKYDSGNPFGLFYTESSCVSNNKYCYYDASDTTVDDCVDCGGINNCYSYRSEGACLSDNCLITGAHSFNAEIGEDSPCSWTDTFEELGKGVCYDEAYSGINYCELCNKDSKLFYNLDCTQDICSNLGSCYLQDFSCESCLGNTKCSDFGSEESCVNADSSGNQEVNIDGCPIDIIRSNDACDLGACKWGVPSGGTGEICFKDANDDGSSDCDPGETSCEDFEPFNTEPQPDIPKMNANGTDIHFYLNDGGIGNLDSFYFCIDKNNTCCPNTEKSTMLLNREIILNPIDETDIINETGTYFIRYYSIDTNDNIEEVKSTEFFVDPIKPEMVFDHYFYAAPDYKYVAIVAASDKYVTCSYNLNGIPPENVSSTNFDSGSNNTFFIRFRGLLDGNYVFSTSCEDDVGNLVERDYPFYVNFVYNTRAGSPNMKILNSTEVEFKLTSTDDARCVLSAINSTASGVPYNKLPGEPVIMDKTQIILNNLYNHTKTLNLVQDVSYVIKATCTPLIEGKDDSVLFYFTIDKQPPVTSTEFDFSAYHRLDADGLITIEFSCDDPNINGVPGESGCSEIRLCEGLSSQCSGRADYDISLDAAHPEYTLDRDAYISYFSIDNNGNEESDHRFLRIKLDGDGPTQVDITSPIGAFTNNKYARVDVTARDSVGIDYVQIKIEKVDPLYARNITNATSINAEQYRLNNAQLYDGLNLITAMACDNALNCRYDDHYIYLDIYPPEIENITLIDFDFDTDSNNVFEYEEGLFFTVNIADKYMHAGNNLREGVGTDTSTVKIKIDSGGNLVMPLTNMVADEDDYYHFNVTQNLAKGEYNATIEAMDHYGNYDKKQVSFNITDTLPPSLTLTQLPPVVYDQAYEITGTTDPLVNIELTIYDASGLNPVQYYGQGNDFSESLVEFNDIGVATTPSTGAFPVAGEDEIYFDDDYMDRVGLNDYIEFSGHTKTPRYKIIGKQLLFGSKTKLTIEPALEQGLDRNTASVYISEIPSGWFNIPVVLREGINVLRVEAIDGSSISVFEPFPRIEYSTIYAPAIQLDSPPSWTESISNTLSPVFSGSIISSTTGVIVTESKFTINGVTSNLNLAADGGFTFTAAPLPADDNYSFTIFANNSAGYSYSKSGSIAVDTAGPGGCIIIGDINYCTPDGTSTCADSDGGQNYYLDGTITGADNLPGVDWSDECNETITTILHEGVCKTDGSNNYDKVEYECPNGCSDGVCII